MGVVQDQANIVYRDYNTDGVPSSGAKQPVKADIRSLFTTTEATFVTGPASAIDGRLVAFLGATGKLVKDSGIATADLALKTGASMSGPIVLKSNAELWVNSSDNFRLRVSSDGLAWVDALIVDKADGQLQAVNGSAAKPAYSFNGDSDTGISHPAANTVAISTNGGVSTFTFDGNGLALTPKGGGITLAFESTNNSCTENLTSGADDLTLRTILNLRKTRLANVGSGGTGAVQGGDNIGAVHFQAWTGAAYATVGRVSSIMTEPVPGVGAVGAKLRLQTTTVGGTALTPFDFEGGIGLSYNAVVVMDDQRLFTAGAGTAAKPAYTFQADPDTGMYRVAANTLGFGTAGIDALQIDSAQHVYGFKLHDNASLPSGTTNQYLASGTYIPSLSNTLNMAASVGSLCQWMRVGNVVTVSGKVNVDPTAAAATTLGISLPIPSAITADNQCSGVACCAAVAGQCAAIIGDTVNKRATMQWVAVDLAARDMQFSFTYVIV